MNSRTGARINGRRRARSTPPRRVGNSAFLFYAFNLQKNSRCYGAEISSRIHMSPALFVIR
jgi:hypothetical protein